MSEELNVRSHWWLGMAAKVMSKWEKMFLKGSPKYLPSLDPYSPPETVGQIGYFGDD